MQVALARLRYSIVESLLEVDPGIVLHGDTAIWRCYSGNRFSEDVDICATDAQVDKPGKLITWSLSKRNIKMDYPLRTSRAVNVLSNDARSKFEAMEFPGGLKPVRMEFRKSDGSKMEETLYFNHLINSLYKFYLSQNLRPGYSPTNPPSLILDTSES